MPKYDEDMNACIAVDYAGIVVSGYSNQIMLKTLFIDI